MGDKIAEMDQTIALKKTNHPQAASAIIKSDAGMKMMKEISGLFQKLTINQKFKEVKAKQDIYIYRNEFKNYTIFTGLFIFICFLSIGMLFYWNQKSINQTDHQLTTDSFIANIEEKLKATKESTIENKDYVPSL